MTILFFHTPTIFFNLTFKNFIEMENEFLPKFLNKLAEANFKLTLGRFIDILDDLDRKYGTKGIYKSFETNSQSKLNI